MPVVADASPVPDTAKHPPEREETPSMFCPKCHSTHIKKSRSGRLRLPLSLFIVCMRCHSCGAKFYRLRRRDNAPWRSKKVAG